MNYRLSLRAFLLSVCAFACAAIAVYFFGSFAQVNRQPALRDDGASFPAAIVSPTGRSLFGGSTHPQNDALSQQGVASRPSESDSQWVQVTPLPSIPVHTQLGAAWSQDKSFGLRSVQLHDGAKIGPVAIRSHRGHLLVVDGADNRLVHMSSDGRIVESIDLPVHPPQQVDLTDDGRVLVWGASEVDSIFLSTSFLGDIQLMNGVHRWEKVSRPRVLDPKTKTLEPLIPTHFSSVGGVLYAEHKSGQLFPLISQSDRVDRMLPGRPAASARVFIRAGQPSGGEGPRVVQAINKSKQLIWERELPNTGRESRVLALENIPSSNFFVVAWEGSQLGKVKTLCAKFNFSGDIVAFLELEQTEGDGFKVWNPIVVDDKNSFLHMIVRASGIIVERHAWK